MQENYKVFYRLVNKKEKVGKWGTSGNLQEFVDAANKADAEQQLNKKLLTETERKAGWRVQVERMIPRTNSLQAAWGELPWADKASCLAGVKIL